MQLLLITQVPQGHSKGLGISDVNFVVLLIARRVGYELEHICSNVEQPRLRNPKFFATIDNIQ